MAHACRTIASLKPAWPTESSDVSDHCSFGSYGKNNNFF